MPQGDALTGNRKLCLIDSGYALGHEDVPGSTRGSGYNGNLPWAVGGDGHGTHVAGTIAALNNAGTGVVGVNAGGNLNLYIVRVFGNDGKPRVSYPAGTTSVMSVAAVDINDLKADFSQYNSTVEISGPGMGVLSTMPNGLGLLSSLSVGSLVVEAFPFEGSPKVTASGALFDFGIGNAINTGAVVYNNASGAFSGTLGTTVTSIPSVAISHADGNTLLGRLGQNTAMGVSVANHLYLDGTSMATPHVSAVAAVVWSSFTPAAPTANRTCTAAQLRNSLNLSAKDLGAPGRDVNFGFGLVQARAAYDRIVALGCGL